MLGGISINILVVNVVWSFILGVFSVVSPFLNLDTYYILFMSVGFCGSLTSMSALALETCNLLDNRYFHLAILNITANAFLSLGALVAGRTLTTMILLKGGRGV